MPIKVRKTYQAGANREEMTSVIEVGLGVNLNQTADGIPRIDVNAAGPTLDVGTTTNITPNYLATSVNKATLGAGVCAVNAPAGTQDAGTYILILQNNGSGNGSLVWNSIYKWPGGVAPTMPATANMVMIVTFVAVGSFLYGVSVTDFR
jgi:hypothetical protein